MRLARSATLAYVLPLLAIASLTALLGVALVRLAAIQEDIHDTANPNMLWVISQARAEALKLESALYQRALHPGDPADVQLRYDVLLSRVKLLEEGPQMRHLLKTGVSRDIVAHIAAIRDMGHSVGDAIDDAGHFATIRERLSAFGSLLEDAASKAMIDQWEQTGTRHDQYRDGVQAITFLMIGILLCSIFISAKLLLTLKKTHEHEKARLRALELQRELEAERRMNEMYRNFAAMISHQFRTPLAIIDASMQRLIRAAHKLGPTEVARRATKVRTAAARLTQLVESTLHAESLLDSAQAHLQPVDLAGLARQVIKSQNGLSDTRSISVQNEADATGLAWCDPVLTEQILLNFVSNAIKYSTPGTPVRLRIYQEGAWLNCDVGDTGPGISAADLPHVFERYYRSRSVEELTGTGLGLYIARELALVQHGEVRVHSAPGQGSTFTLRLPLAPVGGTAGVLAEQAGRTLKEATL